MLSRKGNKSKLADKIISHFPPHDCYIEPFFGSGAIFFRKPKVQYNLLNDIDKNVYHLFYQLQFNGEEFREKLSQAIIHETCIKEKWYEIHPDPAFRAVYYLLSCNYSIMAENSSLQLNRLNFLTIAQSRVDSIVEKLQGVLFANKGAIEFLNAIGRCSLGVKSNFVYLDPPYLNTKAYKNNFTEQDLIDLIDTLISKNIKFAISEFESPQMTRIAEVKGLRINHIAERRNLRNRATEVLLTNYEPILAQSDRQLLFSQV